MMFFHVPTFPAGPSAVSPEPSKRPTEDSLPSSFWCCRKILFVQVLLCVSLLLYFLCMLLGVSAYLEGSGQNDESHPEITRNMSRKLAIFGCIGLVANGLALVGIIKKQRVFLIPIILFLAATLLLDGILALVFVTSRISNSSGINSGSDMLTLSIQTAPKNRILLGFLKMIVTLIMFRCVLDVYRKDLSLRSSRSPFRSKTKDLRAEEGDASPVKSPKLKEYARFL